MLDSLLPNGNDCWYVVLQNQNKLNFFKPFLDTNDVNIEIHSRYVLSYESKVWSIGNNVVELNGSKYYVEMIWSRNDSQHHRMHLMIKIVDPNIHDHQDHQQQHQQQPSIAAIAFGKAFCESSHFLLLLVLRSRGAELSRWARWGGELVCACWSCLPL